VPEGNLTKSQWDTLVERIYDGRCVPFLGAGANIYADGSRVPLGRDVAMRLVRKLMSADEMEVVEALVQHVEAQTAGLGRYGEFANLGLHDLGRVALHYVRENDPSALAKLLESIIIDGSHGPSPLLDALARLRRRDGSPLRLIVTTNYDGLMEQALQDRAVPFEPVHQEIEGFDADAHRALQMRLSDSKRLILYKIHGSFRGGGNGGGSSLIVTEEDYIKFLTVLRRKDDVVGVPPQIESELVGSTLLFLGYGLEDWDFRTIHKGLIENLREHDRRRSFAIQHKPSDFLVKFWDRKGVDIVDMDVSTFAAGLVEACCEYERDTGRRVYDAG
jgi:hypothetical protein